MTAHRASRIPHPAGGFTLVELLVVIGIMLLLAAMTIGAINLSITSERTRAAARQVQSLLEGARDRAIYAQEPRGVRILVNEQITEDIQGNEVATLATTLVYIGSPGEDTSEPDYNDEDQDGDTSELFKYINVVDPTQFPNTAPNSDPNFPWERLATKTIIGVNTRWSALYEQGLIGPGTVIRISPNSSEDARESAEFFTIDPRSFPVRRESFWFGATVGMTFDNPPISEERTNYLQSGNPGQFAGPPVDDNEVLFLAYESQQVSDHSVGAAKNSRGVHEAPWAYVMETNPDVLPGEDPSVLPRNTCIDLETSHLPANWLTSVIDPTSDPNNPTYYRQYSNRMDILFSPNGSIIGEEGASGLVHLHVCDVADAIANAPPGSPTYRYEEPPNSGNFITEERNGDEFGVTIFTRSGRVNVHPMIAVDLDLVANNNPNQVEGATYPPNGQLNIPPNMPTGNGIGQWDPQSPPSPQLGDIIAPSIYNGLIYRLVDDSGGGSGDEPNWNTNPGGLTVDQGQTWLGIKHDVWRLGVEGELAR